MSYREPEPGELRKQRPRGLDIHPELGTHTSTETLSRRKYSKYLSVVFGVLSLGFEGRLTSGERLDQVIRIIGTGLSEVEIPNPGSVMTSEPGRSRAGRNLGYPDDNTAQASGR